MSKFYEGATESMKKLTETLHFCIVVKSCGYIFPSFMYRSKLQ